MAWFQNNFREMFFLWPCTKNAKNDSTPLNKIASDLFKKKKTKKKTYFKLMAQIQNNFTEMFFVMALHQNC